jgi:hypothetical protein
VPVLQGAVRPDGGLVVDKVMLVHDEDKEASLPDAIKDLERKLGKPQNPLLVGNIPFIIVMACAGKQVQFGFCANTGKV